MYEVNLRQAGGIEVIRGLGAALQGSDAIGGVVNILTRTEGYHLLPLTLAVEGGCELRCLRACVSAETAGPRAPVGATAAGPGPLHSAAAGTAQ